MIWRDVCLFFFNDTATTEIYTLSLHDALPIYREPQRHSARRAERPGAAFWGGRGCFGVRPEAQPQRRGAEDRKSTRLNSSHANISYAVFCLKKNKKNTTPTCTHTIFPTPTPLS